MKETMSKQEQDCDFCNMNTRCIAKYLSGEELIELTQNKRAIALKKGKYIFKQGDRAGQIFFLQEGMVKILHSLNSHEQSIVSIASAGEIIGIESLLSANKYATSAEVLTASKVCEFDSKYFIDFMNRHGQSYKMIIQMLLEKLASSYKAINALMNKPAKSRIAKTLLFINPLDDIHITISRADLAKMVGATRETVTRVLSDFYKNNLIDIEQRKIAVKDRQKLELISAAK